MTLTLNLSPSIEQELEASAARDGVPTGVLAMRLLASALRQKKTFEELQAKAAADFAASGISEDEVYSYGETLVKQVRAEMNAQPAQP